MPSAEVICGMFYAELSALLPVWKQRPQADPATLRELECEVQEHFIRGADPAVTGLSRGSGSRLRSATTGNRCDANRSLRWFRSGGARSVCSVQLLEGLVM